MRYQVGEVIYGVHFKIFGSGRTGIWFSNPFMNDDRPVEKITIKKLVVSEHQKVCSIYDKVGKEPTYDGFVLKDEDGNIWCNQYPKASYGQTSDYADRLFSLYTEEVKVFDACEESGTPVEYYLLTDVVGNLSRGIKHHSKQVGDSWSEEFIKKLTELKEQILKQLKEEFGVELQEVPMFEKHSDITHFIVAN